MRILTVDDSRAIRAIVSKQVIDMGFEVDEAEHGEAGLAQLEECVYDLIVLDVTMPVLDGPGMLAKLREAGNKTPVLMLTSESKRSVIADCMKLGIEDYILKPFKPEELRAKVTKVLARAGITPPAAVATSGADAPVAPAPAPMAAPAAAAAPTQGRQFIDILLVDDMENVQKKLRGMLPAHISLNGCVSAQSAISLCRERVYRVILLDNDIPDVDSMVLCDQLRMLQPSCAVLMLALRSNHDLEKDARQKGFDGVMFKPFDATSVEDFLLRYFDSQETLQCVDNVLKPHPFTGKEDRVDVYFQRLRTLAGEAVERVAAACYDDAIMDLGPVPARADLVPRFVIDLDKRMKAVGVQLRLVGTPDQQKILKTLADTAEIPFFPSVSAAQAA